MTLAAILFVLLTLSPQQSASAPATATATQSQNNTQQQNSTTPSQSQPAQSNSTPKKPSASAHTTHRPHKKKVQSPDCTSAPTTGPTTPASSADSTQPATTAANPPAAGNTSGGETHSTPTNCPPPKIVVVQGGTSEPSIQLAGDAKSSQLRDTNQCPNASQCLQSAQQNLQKIAGRQLTTSQRDMVTQVNQFMDQSKHATDSGDVESARTLAWKAQQLSQELVGPEK